MCMTRLKINAIFMIIGATMAYTILLFGGFFMPKVACAKQDTHLIASFSTYYGDSSSNRKANILLASSKINGLKLYPEEEFSFNDVVGARSEAHGFKSAYIIVDGQYVEGFGGGVCQVSTTLYNCALLSNLAITCVRPHTLQSTYVAPSFDAMVSSGSDFRFVNTLSSAITIKMIADGKNLTAEIYGVESFEIKRRSQTIEYLPFDIEYRPDNTLPLGQEKIDAYGRQGIKSEGYLDYYKNGKLVESVLIRRDTYRPQKRVVLLGTSVLTDGSEN